MDTSLLVTFIGDDRPGLVEELSAAIEQSGGNWLESRLSQLAGKFAGIILVAIPEAERQALEASLKSVAGGNLRVALNASPSQSIAAPGRDIKLNVIGPDRPGIVREISSALAARQINVQEMQSAVNSAPMSAEMIFSAQVEARIPEDVDMDDLIDTLDDIANQMTLEIELV